MNDPIKTSPEFTQTATLGLLLIGLATCLFLTSSLLSLSLFQAQRATQDNLLLQQGHRWEFDRIEDLVGGDGTGFTLLEQQHGYLHGKREESDAFISLNFYGRKLDASLFSTLDILIWSSVQAELSFYFRAEQDGSVFKAPPLSLKRGWNQLTIPMIQPFWSKADFDNSGKQLNEWTPAQWGGVEKIVSSIRIHPLDRAGEFRLDYVRIQSPISTASDGSGVNSPLTEAFMPDRHPIVQSKPFLQRPETILAERDRLTEQLPAASLVISPLRNPITEGLFGKAQLALLAVGTLMLLISLIRQQTAIELIGLTSLGTSTLTASSFNIYTVLAVSFSIGWLITQLKAGRLSANWISIHRSERVWMVSAVLLTVLSAALLTGELSDIVHRLPVYLPWALIQQSLLCAVFYGLTSKTSLPGLMKTFIPALIFGWLHYPNFALMTMTLIFGLACIWLYRRGTGIVWLAIAHAFIGAAALTLLPESILRSGEVGLRYFQ